LWAFAVLDEWSRESLAIEVDVALTGARVTRVLARLRGESGLPLVLQADKGPELRGRVLDQWAYAHAVKRQFIAPGKPRVSTPGCAKSVSMNTSSFRSLMPAAKSNAGASPTASLHSSLGNLTPEEFAANNPMSAAA
jgi:putative transposase